MRSEEEIRAAFDVVTKDLIILFRGGATAEDVLYSQAAIANDILGWVLGESTPFSASILNGRIAKSGPVKPS